LCLLLLIAVLVQEGGGVISGPRSRRDLGQQELRTVELEGDGTGGETSEPLSHSRSAEERAGRRLHKRQTSSDGIGYTAALNGDNHNQAVVHWTGYPSEHLFIVTRDRETNDIYSHSRESWLWRWVCPSLIISSIPSLLIHLVSCPTGQLTTATIFVMILTSSETPM